jgi:hypothetical protein
MEEISRKLWLVEARDRFGKEPLKEHIVVVAPNSEAAIQKTEKFLQRNFEEKYMILSVEDYGSIDVF